MQPIQVSVTAADIAAGRPKSCRECPIALAIRRDDQGASVGVSCLWSRDAGYNLPPEAMSFIAKFDQGQPVEPFEFFATPFEIAQAS